jgi:hypothetical protein
MIRPSHHVPRLAIAYKNFAANKGLSHIGLGVSAMQNAKALRAAEYIAEVWPIIGFEDLASKLQQDRATAINAHHNPVTHVVISAPWIPTQSIAQLVHSYPDIEFAVVSHSNIGFLQADPRAIDLLRSGAELAHACPNFHIGGNSDKFCTWWRAAYGSEILLLPNMYPFASIRHKPLWSGGLLRIGCFCAIRAYKNVLTAAAAALETGVRLRASELEFYISGGRSEGGAGIRQAITEMYKGLLRSRVIDNNWQSWPQFVTTVGEMDLLLQPSYTEGFNMVTADGISKGVPSVVGEAIGWVPSNWVASTDAACDIANRAIALLHDPGAINEGVTALIRHNTNALSEWKSFLTLYP